MFRHTFLFTIGLTGAIICAQFPAFYDQYIQRLGGAVDETQQQVTNIINLASSLNKSAVQLIDELIWEEGRNAEIGKNYAATFQRRNDLVESRNRLKTIPVWARTYALIRYGDTDILRGTWHDYTPSVPITWNGFIYAVLGFFCAGFVYEIFLWVLWLPFSYRTRKNT